MYANLPSFSAFVRGAVTLRSIGVSMVLVLTGCAAPEVNESAPAPAASRAAADGISRSEAVDVARDALQGTEEEWDVVLAEAGPLGQVRPGWEDSEWGRDLSADIRVWRVVLVAGELSAEVVLDQVDGLVYSSIIGIAN